MAAFLVNGWPAQSVDLADRGFMYGDGVFRTLLVKAGRPLNWDRHYRLLERDCAMLGLACPAPSVLLDELRRVAPGEATAKLIVTRGASGRGYAIPDDASTSRIVVAYPRRPEATAEAREGVRVRRCELALALQPRLAGVKSLNRLENVLARAEWNDPGIREGLLADAEGRLVEGTMSNVFLVRGGTLCTPALTRCGVNGAQRERVIELAAREGVACEVRDIAFEEIREADEVFLTNSIIGIWPVVALDRSAWRPGPVAALMQRRVEAEDAQGH